MRTIRASILTLCLIAPQALFAQAQPANPPYTLADVVLLVEGGHSAPRILSRVGPDCIAFRLNAAAEAELQRVGADASLMEGLREVCYKALTPPAAAPPQQPQGVLEIIGEMPPGWSRIVNELPPTPNRTITLTGGRPAVIVVDAPGWCPDRLEVTLQAGERRNWTPALRGRPWVGSC